MWCRACSPCNVLKDLDAGVKASDPIEDEHVLGRLSRGTRALHDAPHTQGHILELLWDVAIVSAANSNRVGQRGSSVTQVTHRRDVVDPVPPHVIDVL